MKNNLNFKIIGKNFSNSFKNIGSDADKDWRFILTLFIIFIFASGVFHSKLFFGFKNGLPEKIDAAGGETLSVDSNALKSMINEYEKREREFNKIGFTTPTLIDPAR